MSYVSPLPPYRTTGNKKKSKNKIIVMTEKKKERKKGDLFETTRKTSNN